MRKTINLVILGILAILMMDSCNSKKITASFKPSHRHLPTQKKFVEKKQKQETEEIETAKKEKESESAQAQIVEQKEAETTFGEKGNEFSKLKETIDNKNVNVQQIKRARKELRRLVWKQLKSRLFRKKEQRPHSEDELILLVILAIFIPPLAVYLYDGAATGRFWLNFVLALLGILSWWYFWGLLYIIAIIHALVIVFSH